MGIMATMAMWKLCFDSGPLYYVLCSESKKGDITYVSETEFGPEFVMLHPDDWDEFQTEFERELIPLQEAGRVSAA